MIRLSGELEWQPIVYLYDPLFSFPNQSIIIYYNFLHLFSTMAGVQKRRASSAKNKKLHRAMKTKHYIKDHDQIHEDIKNPEKFEQMEIDEDRPGSGQYYCISCSRYF